MSHTPGPHYTIPEMPGLIYADIGGVPVQIGTAWSGGVGSREPGIDQSLANARLWAAAPDLLAACRGMLNPTGHTDACAEISAFVGVPTRCTRACAAVRAAIAAATPDAATDDPAGPQGRGTPRPDTP